MHSMPYDIAGYDWHGSRYTPADLIDAMIANGVASPAARDMDPEDVLDQIAGANGVDRYDESSYSDHEFPKVVVRDQWDDDDDDPGDDDESGDYDTSDPYDIEYDVP
jgi:hypothetical protein